MGGKEAVPHKPPFDNQVHISGQNLFVSAYDGFATLGDEHIPTPQRFVNFPPFAVKMENAVRMNGSLVISTVVTMAEGMDAGRHGCLSSHTSGRFPNFFIIFVTIIRDYV